MERKGLIELLETLSIAFGFLIFIFSFNGNMAIYWITINNILLFIIRNKVKEQFG